MSFVAILWIENKHQKIKKKNQPVSGAELYGD